MYKAAPCSKVGAVASAAVAAGGMVESRALGVEHAGCVVDGRMPCGVWARLWLLFCVQCTIHAVHAHLCTAACWRGGHAGCCTALQWPAAWDDVMWSRVLSRCNALYTMSCHQDHACGPWHAAYAM